MAHESEDETVFKENEYNINPDDSTETKLIKTIKRQQNFHDYAKQNPVIVESDQNIVSLD